MSHEASPPVQEYFAARFDPDLHKYIGVVACSVDEALRCIPRLDTAPSSGIIFGKWPPHDMFAHHVDPTEVIKITGSPASLPRSLHKS